MSKDDDYEYLYSAEDIRILEKYLGHKVKNVKVKKIKKLIFSSIY